MPRTFTPSQLRQNEAFLDSLRRTGNVRLTAVELGLNRSTYTKRRSKDAAFAKAWDAALEAFSEPSKDAQAEKPDVSLVTKGGELRAIRTRSGHLQLRRTPPGRMTADAEKTFLATLASSANVRLAAESAGFAHSSFYAKRQRNNSFAEVMDQALAEGYDRLEGALLESATGSLEDDPEAREEERGPLPKMTVDEAMMLLRHHQTIRRRQAQPHASEVRRVTNGELASQVRALLRIAKEKFGNGESPEEL